jgi:WD40 repeat protein
VKEIEAHHRHEAIYCLKTLPNNQVASGSSDKTIRIWNLKTTESIATLTGHRKAVLCFCYYTEKNILISGSEDHIIKLWNMTTYQFIKGLNGHDSSIKDLRLTLDYKLVSSSYDHTIKVWDMTEMTVKKL